MGHAGQLFTSPFIVYTPSLYGGESLILVSHEGGIPAIMIFMTLFLVKYLAKGAGAEAK